MSASSSLSVRRLAGALGAEVTGLDVAALDGETFAALHRVFLDHQVICIRGQAHVTPDQELALARRFGEVSIHPYVPSIEGYPGIMTITDPNDVTSLWHADSTHVKAPPALTLLLARTLPPVGGDTMFSSATAAFESLSEGLQSTLLGLRAIHQGTALAASAGLSAADVTASHPVVRTHPETGKRALFVNGNYTKHFDGWTVAESQPLLDYLYGVVARPEFTYRHRWHDGDLLIWDNRATQHAVVSDTGGATRILHRVTVLGDVPV